MAAGDWGGARDAFSAVLEIAEVPEAFFGLANALFWLGDIAGTIAYCEKAYAGFRRRPDPLFAAGAALSLVGYNKGYLGNTAAARGWLSRAARIINSEVPQLRGELLGATAYVTDDPVESEALARQAVEIGRANGNSDLELMAMHAVGQALVQQGRTEEGMSLLDEAMAGVIGGEGGDPLTVAQMSCMTMVVCGSCFDLERATQWVQSLQGFIDRFGCPFLYAECRTYYGRVLFENGDWGAAETFLTDAIDMSRGVFAAPHAFACGTLAELRLAQGRLEDAARVLRGVEGREEAAAAVASVHLARGEPAAAAAVLRRRLAATSPDRLDVAAVIELLGEAAIALDDIDTAIERGRALVALGAASNCHLIVAHGERLVGHALASTDVLAACGHLETALAAFAQAGIPYRTAQTRLLLARLLKGSDLEHILPHPGPRLSPPEPARDPLVYPVQFSDDKIHHHHALNDPLRDQLRAVAVLSHPRRPKIGRSSDAATRALRRTLRVRGTRQGSQSQGEPCARRGGEEQTHEYEHGPGARIAVVLADRGCPLRDVRGRT